MNETKHTTSLAVMESIISDWRTILDYEYQADRFEDDDLSNLARLFDAFPELVHRANCYDDLLEAAKGLLDYCEAYESAGSDEMPQEWMKAARAAIAKAEGSS